jgi:hypothetical protein
MAVELNHTIVPAHDPKASAQFLAGIFGLEVGPPAAHFTPVTLSNRVCAVGVTNSYQPVCIHIRPQDAQAQRQGPVPGPARQDGGAGGAPPSR